MSEDKTSPEPPDAEGTETDSEASTSEAGAASDTSNSEPTAALGTIVLKILRQEGPDKPETRHYEEFQVPITPGLTLLGALKQIQRKPRTSAGDHVSPVAWEESCLEEICGACTMLVNGRVQQACGVRVQDFKKGPITLEPLEKFPVVRDLVVDRSRMFESLTRVQSWVDVDATLDRPAPAESPRAQRMRAELGACTACGACLEACPQYGAHSDYVGAFALTRVDMLSQHAVGRHQQTDRLRKVMGSGGVEDCGKAQVCVEVCPSGVPVVDAIQRISRQATKELLFGWLLK